MLNTSLIGTICLQVGEKAKAYRYFELLLTFVIDEKFLYDEVDQEVPQKFFVALSMVCGAFSSLELNDKEKAKEFLLL